MKVMLVNGSPHEHGCTDAALREVASALNADGIDAEIFWIGNTPIGGCIACGGCSKAGKCVFDGSVNDFAEKAKDADNKMIVFSVFCCSVMAAVMLLVGGFFPQIYNTTDEIKSLATSFIAVSAIIMPFCAFTHSSYFTLRSGGKTLVTFLFDSVFTWVIVVPVAFVLAKYTALGIVAVYFLVQATELIKVVIGYFMVKSDVWLVQMV